MDYLQEVNFYQNRLQLPSFRVDFETYKLLQECSTWGQSQISLIKPDLSKVNHGSIDNIEPNSLQNAEYFSLTPPFPEVELTNIGPVFLENGLVYLYCEYSFVNIRCTVDGKIPAEKIYFHSTYFRNPNYETITINFGFEEFFSIFKLKHKPKNINNNKTPIDWEYQDILKSNLNNVELFTNYIILFGVNGTNMNFLNDKEEFNLDKISILNKYKYYNFIRKQIGMLFTLFYFKLTNFLLFATVILFHFIMHIPVYIFTCFKYKPATPNGDTIQIDEYDLKGFKEWIDNKQKIEKKIKLFDDNDNIYESKYSKLNSVNGSIRLRKVSNPPEKMINIDLKMPSPCFTTGNFYGNDEIKNQSPISLSTTISSHSAQAIKFDLENQNSSTEFKISNSTLVNADFVNNKPEEVDGNIIVTSKMDEVIDKYCLFYLIYSVYVLFHLIIYEIFNIVLYNLISGIFTSIETSDPINFNPNIKSIFGIPTVLLGDSSSTTEISQIHKHSNMIFNALLNLCGCLFNIFMALLFHGIYTFMIYKYTISIY